MYDNIASLYHLVYRDWDAAITAQAEAIDGLVSGAATATRLLDISCGIGTQSLGLANLGYQVTASDLSSASIDRASNEALARDLRIDWQVADMQQCFEHHGGGFDVVLSTDNAMPHLKKPGVIQTLKQCFLCLTPGGRCIVSIRDYLPDEARERGQVFHYGIREAGEDRYIVFQTRDWSGSEYDVAMYFVREPRDNSPAHTVTGRSRYHAMSIEELMDIFRDTGFINVTRHDNVLHQPVIIGDKP